MKKLIAILFAIISLHVSAGQILWAGINENALVYLGNQTLNINDWNLTLTCAPVDVGARIRIGDTALLAGYENPPRQNPPVVVFEDGISEFGVLLVDSNDEPTGGYANWQPIKIPDEVTKSHIEIFFDVGYWDENADWEFVTVATAIDYVDNIWDAHTYTTGTLLPPTETPWKPLHYYGIPEPSTAFMGLLGLGLLFNRRKCAKHFCDSRKAKSYSY